MVARLVPAAGALLLLVAAGYWVWKGLWISTAGRVAATRVRVSSPVTGRLASIAVVEGVGVRQGQVVARLEDAELQAELKRVRLRRDEAAAGLTELERAGLDPAVRVRVEAARKASEENAEAVRRAEAELARARAERDRAREAAAREEKLLLLKATTRERWETIAAEERMADAAVAAAEAKLDESRAAEQGSVRLFETEQAALQHAERRHEAEIARLALALRQAEAEVDRAKTLLDRSVILAPRSGIVWWLPRRAGDVVDHNDVILEIFDPGEVWIEAYVTGADLSNMFEGQTATIQIEGGPTAALRGRVRTIAPPDERKLRVGPQEARSASHLAELLHPVKIEFEGQPPQGLRPEMIARVRIDR
jgi:multidrug resistance efflux pump